MGEVTRIPDAPAAAEAIPPSPAQRVLRAYAITKRAEVELSDDQHASGLTLLAHAVVTSLVMKLGADAADRVLASARSSAERAAPFPPGAA